MGTSRYDRFVRAKNEAVLGRIIYDLNYWTSRHNSSELIELLSINNSVTHSGGSESISLISFVDSIVTPSTT